MRVGSRRSGHCQGKSLADAEALLGLTEQQGAAVGRLVAAVEIDCELLAGDGWQVEWEQAIVGHGRGVPLQRKHASLATVCYAISADYATASVEFLNPDA